MLVDYLPEVLLINVLLRLSVDSLVRLKFVCKSLCNLISSQSFKEEHYRNAPPLLLVQRKDIRSMLLSRNGYEFSISFVDDDVERVIIDIPFPGKVPWFIGTHIGIFCLHFNCTRELALWNPALREYRVLPRSSMNIKTHTLNFGFGYDATTNDYKVVRISSHHGKEHVQIIDDVEVCSLRAGVWRKLHVSDPLLIGKSTMKFIMSVDMSDEKLYRASLPPGINVNGSALLMVLEEHLAIICTSAVLEERTYHVWIRDGDHISGSWTRGHNVDMTELSRAIPSMSLKNVECWCKCCRNPAFYDFARGELAFHEELSKPSALTVCYYAKYKESLVSVMPSVLLASLSSLGYSGSFYLEVR